MLSDRYFKWLLLVNRVWGEFPYHLETYKVSKGWKLWSYLIHCLYAVLVILMSMINFLSNRDKIRDQQVLNSYSNILQILFFFHAIANSTGGLRHQNRIKLLIQNLPDASEQNRPSLLVHSLYVILFIFPHITFLYRTLNAGEFNLYITCIYIVDLKSQTFQLLFLYFISSAVNHFGDHRVTFQKICHMRYLLKSIFKFGIVRITLTVTDSFLFFIASITFLDRDGVDQVSCLIYITLLLLAASVSEIKVSFIKL